MRRLAISVYKIVSNMCVSCRRCFIPATFQNERPCDGFKSISDNLVAIRPKLLCMCTWSFFLSNYFVSSMDQPKLGAEFWRHLRGATHGRERW